MLSREYVHGLNPIRQQCGISASEHIGFGPMVLSSMDPAHEDVSNRERWSEGLGRVDSMMYEADRTHQTTISRGDGAARCSNPNLVWIWKVAICSGEGGDI